MRRFLLAVALFTLTMSLVQAQSTEVIPTVETEPSPNNGANGVTIWVHPTDSAQSTIIATDKESGLVVYDLDGKQLQFLEDGELENVDLRYNFPLGDTQVTIVGATNSASGEVLLYTVDDDTRELTAAGTITPALSDISGFCLYRSKATGKYFAFINNEDGDVEQFELSAVDGEVVGESVRTFGVGSETEGCAADDDLGNLYIGEQEVGIWKYGAEPETGNSRKLVDTVGDHIIEEVEGLSLYYAGEEAGYLIAVSDASSEFIVYDRAGDNEYIGTFTIGAGEGIDAVSDINSIAVTNLPLGDAFPNGLFVAGDEENTDPNAASDFKLVPWDAVATALDLTTDVSHDPRAVSAAIGGAVAQVAALFETAPVANNSDAADDPAIWLHPTDLAQSTIIGTNKGGGLSVYDLDGNEIQFLQQGRMNNVDLRYNFPLGGERIALVTSGNRADDTIGIFKVNPETRQLEDVAARPLKPEFVGIYGSCMYYSSNLGEYYVFIDGKDGQVEQWMLFDNGEGKVDGLRVRTFNLESQVEGCVADDELGYLYIGEEKVAIWKFNAEPDADDSRMRVDSAEPEGHFKADIEGLTIYYGLDGTGYLIASSQGNNRYTVYTREGDNTYLGIFQIAAGVVDGTTDTDGIDLTNLPLNTDFPQGMFVAQDGDNTDPDERQNFKVVSWEAVASALDLTLNTQWDARTIGADS